MLHTVRYFCVLIAFVLSTSAVTAQQNIWRDYHKVKKKETLYSISREYGITVEELMKANPEMTEAGYKLKKGAVIFIPYPSSAANNTTAKAVKTTVTQTAAKTNVRQRAIRLGVMLPLHDKNGDGRRMVEYYRGVLMACDSLKRQGISVDVYAWNLEEDGNAKQVLGDPNAAMCDVIIGPLYSKFVADLSAFAEKYGIMMVIPFSINAPELYNNRHIFQVYQHPTELMESTARRCSEWFKDYHPIIVDCADAGSTKGPFTTTLRRHLDSHGMKYSLTSMGSTDEAFSKAFDATKQNLVVLNTARFTDMNALFGKLSHVSATMPETQISVFGYTEWLTQASRQLENFFRYNVYVPSYFYTNLASAATDRLQQIYRKEFRHEMMQMLPRFAITGFDHAYFFLRGLNKYGETFDGAAGRFGYPAVQTPLKFERIGNGGLQNRAFMFVHYRPDHQIETLNY